MNWNQLSKIAFLGAYRAGLDEIKPQEWQSLGLSQDEEPGRVLMKALVLSHIKSRAGKKSRSLPTIINHSSQPPDRELSSMAALFLESILEGSFSGALGEFLQLSRTKQKTIPAYLLTELMPMVEDGALSWSDLQPLLSDQAYVLLGMHPSWKKYAADTHPADWTSTDVEKRIAYLTFLRSVQADEALQMLQTNWEAEPTILKVKFLKVLKEELSPTDENFLEQCLDDADESVRKQAATLLALLPESALSVRLFEYVFAFFEEMDDGRLKVHFPQKADDYWAHTGLQNKRKKHPFQSHPAALLGQLIGYLHPSYWCTFFNASPDECLAYIEASALTVFLQRGLINAVLLHEEQDWANIMARRLFSEKSSDRSSYSAVLEKIDASTFNELLIRQLKNQSFLIEEDSLAYALIQLGDHPWTDELVKAIIPPFQQWLSSARSAQWKVWHYKQLLEIASYRINPNLLSTFRNGWQFQSYIAFQWQEEVDKFNKTLAFRKGMRKAIMEKKENA